MSRSSPVELAAFDLLISGVAGPAEMASLSHVSQKGSFISDPRLLFVDVVTHGGSQTVTDNKLWAAISRRQELPPCMTDGSYRTKRYYLDYLLPLEQAYASGSMDLRKEIDAGLQGLPPPSTVRPASSTPTDVVMPQTGQPLAKRRAVGSLPTTQLPCRVQAEALVGCRVGVFWPEEQTYFFGSVTAYEPKTGRHVLMYDDGDNEVLELNNEIWVLISNAVTDGGQPNLVEDNTLAPPQAITVQSAAAAPKAILIGGPSCVALDQPTSISRDAVSQGNRFSVFTTRSGMPGFEVYVDIDDFSLSETTVLAYRRGAVLVKAESVAGRGEKFEMLVELPERVDPASAQALLTPTGLLYVRVGLEKNPGNVTNMKRVKGTHGL